MTDPLQLMREVHALSFLRAYARCMEPGAPGLGMPALMCAAFSAELGLKELLRQRNIKFKKEHELLKLLRLLPPEDVEAILAEVRPQWADLDLQLERASKAFVTWRYFFESPTPIEVNEICRRICIGGAEAHGWGGDRVFRRVANQGPIERKKGARAAEADSAKDP